MTRRRKLLLSFVAALGVAGVLAVPAVYWRLVGWAKREPFWKGRPASYYARLTRDAFTAPRTMRAISQPEKEIRRLIPAWVADAVWGGPPPFLSPWGGSQYPEWRPDADFFPVAAVMAGDADARVRWWATFNLAQPGRQPAAVPVLARLLGDPDSEVRAAAVARLRAIGPPARPAVPRLLALLQGETAEPGPGGTGARAIEEAVRAIDPDALSQSAGPGPERSIYSANVYSVIGSLFPQRGSGSAAARDARNEGPP